MAIRVQIDDPDWSITVGMSVSGGYNPDVLDDLRRRVQDVYREALHAKAAVEDMETTTDADVTED